MLPLMSMLASGQGIEPLVDVAKVISLGIVMAPSPSFTLRFPKPSTLTRSGDRITSACRSCRSSIGSPFTSSVNGSAGARLLLGLKLMLGGVGEVGKIKEPFELCA